MREGRPSAPRTQANCTSNRATARSPYREILAKHGQGGTEFGGLGRHGQQLVQPRGAQIVHFDAAHHEDQAFGANQLLVRHARVAQKLGPAALRKGQVARVIDDAAGVGVFVVDADVQAVRQLDQASGPSKSSRGAAGWGAARPR